ncbi:uncharacterized transmembrane DDB_G0293652 isoform X1 [Octopus vulgaris]|uniref:Uncharacterized transmembrane DDB_G0293652 isoform X1 n=1 Tax=Octopus vulgaris TaxID=6645 RepID=A0AA36B3A5_OCTVU|nr:uncharacterized transmembrane DDB_G0293652 isoform X1 [Octopus vulgaris]
MCLMWKRRFRFFMKFAHYFQPYVDKEEKLYDVFISYKSSDADENWVKNILFPKIEDDMGLKACVHFRDFVPGETISNNIIESIQNSRRTLLVLTNDYIDSEWTRMEYQVAQQEMFKLRHRIIPVILEISQSHQQEQLQVLIELRLLPHSVGGVEQDRDKKAAGLASELIMSACGVFFSIGSVAGVTVYVMIYVGGRQLPIVSGVDVADVQD